jgi:hypothetical protein
MENIERVLDENVNGSNKIQEMREQLEAQKRQFLIDLNAKDPHWQEKAEQRRLLEIKRLEQTHEKIRKQVEDRKVAIEKDQQVKDKLLKLKEDCHVQQADLANLSQEQMKVRAQV